MAATNPRRDDHRRVPPALSSPGATFSIFYAHARMTAAERAALRSSAPPSTERALELCCLQSLRQQLGELPLGTSTVRGPASPPTGASDGRRSNRAATSPRRAPSATGSERRGRPAFARGQISCSLGWAYSLAKARRLCQRPSGKVPPETQNSGHLFSSLELDETAISMRLVAVPDVAHYSALESIPAVA